MNLPFLPNHDESSFFDFISKQYPGLTLGGNSGGVFPGTQESSRGGGALTVPLPGGGTIEIPGYMCWAALLYAVLGTWIATRIGTPASQSRGEITAVIRPPSKGETGIRLNRFRKKPE